ncbi:unnamed protein product [Durusdinium trenchii]|uniref:Uncharacterized protein n=2 Tax=Durusdinium trenchii TaxID=1381693 RepID=A0ABP0J4Q8_9DINO
MDSSHYSFDDLYGYSLGYLQGQGFDPELVKNSSQWVTISRQKCLDIQAKYNFQNAAAAAKGVTATTSAVAGSAGVGSLTKGTGVAGKGTGSYSFDPSTQIGAMAPLGYFDPAGLCKKGDEATFRQLRAAELKHGRVAMMAAVGAVAQHYVKFPGFESVPSGLAASITGPGSYGFVALFALAGILELGAWTESDNKEPGNFGDPLGFSQYTQEWREREINNGRFAMFAAIGIIAAELYTGKDAIEQFGL